MLFIIVLFIFVNILINKSKIYILFICRNYNIDYWIIDKDFSWKLFFLLFVKKNKVVVIEIWIIFFDGENF